MPARRLRPIESAVTLEVDGNDLVAQAGEPIAVALWAANKLVLSRSVKYHRPRGAACMTGRCDGCLMRVDGAPSVRTCRSHARHGAVIETQNVLGSASLDLLGAADLVFPGGMNHHEMFTWSRPINRVMQEVARHVAGVGTLPSEPRPPREVERVACDVLVIGAGPAGVACAEALAAAGASVLVLEEEHGVTTELPVRRHTVALGVFDETDGTRVVLATSDAQGPMAITPRTIVIAQGRAEGSEVFEGNDLPGVISLAAARRLLAHHVLPGEKVVLAGESVRADALAAELTTHGARVVRVARDAIRRASGSLAVARVETSDGRKHDCDALIVEGRASACYELAAQAGVALAFDGEVFDLVVADDGSTAHARVFVVGAAAGVTDREEAIGHAQRAAARIAASLAEARRG
jgi:sarcosine oxidase subunit alpha